MATRRKVSAFVVIDRPPTEFSGFCGCALCFGAENRVGDHIPKRLQPSITNPTFLPAKKRKVEVAYLVAEGLGNREIAAQLNLSEHTVKNYLFRIFDKLGISTRVGLVLYRLADPRKAPRRSDSSELSLLSGVEPKKPA